MVEKEKKEKKKEEIAREREASALRKTLRKLGRGLAAEFMKDVQYLKTELRKEKIRVEYLNLFPEKKKEYRSKLDKIGIEPSPESILALHTLSSKRFFEKATGAWKDSLEKEFKEIGEFIKESDENLKLTILFGTESFKAGINPRCFFDNIRHIKDFIGKEDTEKRAKEIVHFGSKMQRTGPVLSALFGPIQPYYYNQFYNRAIHNYNEFKNMMELTVKASELGIAYGFSETLPKAGHRISNNAELVSVGEECIKHLSKLKEKGVEPYTLISAFSTCQKLIHSEKDIEGILNPLGKIAENANKKIKKKEEAETAVSTISNQFDHLEHLIKEKEDILHIGNALLDLYIDSTKKDVSLYKTGADLGQIKQLNKENLIAFGIEINDLFKRFKGFDGERTVTCLLQGFDYLIEKPEDLSMIGRMAASLLPDVKEKKIYDDDFSQASKVIKDFDVIKTEEERIRAYKGIFSLLAAAKKADVFVYGLDKELAKLKEIIKDEKDFTTIIHSISLCCEKGIKPEEFKDAILALKRSNLDLETKCKFLVESGKDVADERFRCLFGYLSKYLSPNVVRDEIYPDAKPLEESDVWTRAHFLSKISPILKGKMNQEEFLACLKSAFPQYVWQTEEFLKILEFSVDKCDAETLISLFPSLADIANREMAEQTISRIKEFEFPIKSSEDFKRALLTAHLTSAREWYGVSSFMEELASFIPEGSEEAAFEYLELSNKILVMGESPSEIFASIIDDLKHVWETKRYKPKHEELIRYVSNLIEICSDIKVENRADVLVGLSCLYGVKAFTEGQDVEPIKKILSDIRVRLPKMGLLTSDFFDPALLSKIKRVAEGDITKIKKMCISISANLHVIPMLREFNIEELKGLSPKNFAPELLKLGVDKIVSVSGYIGPITKEQCEWCIKLLPGIKFIKVNSEIQSLIRNGFENKFREYYHSLSENQSLFSKLKDLGVDINLWEGGIGKKIFKVTATGVEEIKKENVESFLFDILTEVFNNPKRPIFRKPGGAFTKITKLDARKFKDEEKVKKILELKSEEEIMKTLNILEQQLKSATAILDNKMAREGAADALFHVNELQRLLGKRIKSLKIGEKFVEQKLMISIKLTDKNPLSALTNGNDSGCCVAINGCNNWTLPIYMKDSGFQIVEIFIDRGMGEKRVGQAWVFAGIDEEGKPIAVIDSINISGTYKSTNEIYQTSIGYITEWASKAGFKGIVMGRSYNDAYPFAEKLFEQHETYIEKLQYFKERIYLDSVPTDEEGRRKGTKKLFMISSKS